MINILKLRKLEKEKNLESKKVILLEENENLKPEIQVNENNLAAEIPENENLQINFQKEEKIEIPVDQNCEEIGIPDDLILSEESESSDIISEEISNNEDEEFFLQQIAEMEREMNLQNPEIKISNEEKIEIPEVQKNEITDPSEILRMQLLQELLNEQNSTEEISPEVFEENSFEDDLLNEQIASAKSESLKEKIEIPEAKFEVIDISKEIEKENQNEFQKSENKPVEKIVTAQTFESVKVEEKEIKKEEKVKNNVAVNTEENIKKEDPQNKKQTEKILQLVGFSLANEIYAVDITRIKEIIRITEITKVPKAPEFVEGVINLRGSVIPVINLRKKVRMEIKEFDKDTRIIIVEIKGMTIGFIVDAVKEVLRIPENLVAPPPELAVGKKADYITSVAKFNDELIIIMDTEKVLSKDEAEKMSEKKK